MTATATRVSSPASCGGRMTLTIQPGDPTAGTPVLLLHGLSQQRSFWDPVVRRLRTRPVAALDQRGHGDSGTPATADFSVGACADDVVTALDLLGWDRAVVVGHSWGGSVALRAAARHPDRVSAAALIDGGLWSPSGLGPRSEVRERLTPPALGQPAAEVWAMVRRGDLGPYWSAEVQAALEPTFVIDDDGAMRTRLGMERHLLVLDGLLDVDPSADLDLLEESGTRVWAAICAPQGSAPSEADGWAGMRTASAAAAAARPNCLVHHWAGAIHDVPLQWPSLVAGFVDALREDVEGGRT